MVIGKLSNNALSVIERRYLLEEESPEEMFARVAKTMASIDKNYGISSGEIDKLGKKFFDMMWDLDFIPNSPTLMNAGTGQGTLSACYVMDIDDSMDSIMSTAYDQAMIEKFGGGVGFSLSDLRPTDSHISSTQGKACGPIAVLETLSQVGTMITQGGKRDGAHMAIISVYHPNIMDFITCKTEEGKIHNFNISVGADASFMRAVRDNKYIHLVWPLDKKSYDDSLDDSYIKARQIFKSIILGAWSNGEPGMVWLDNINKDNTTPQLGNINATNPCGEQPLLSGESCNLGSINLGNFIKDSAFDSDKFAETVRLCTRFLDNVVDANHHPTDKTTDMNRQTRKIGLGVMGWADLLSKLNIPYDSEDAINLADLIGSNLKDIADAESSKIGKEKGNFPAFDESPLNSVNGGEWGHMRNAWRLSIAPTGTISMIADASSGIEPHFSLAYKKQNMSSQMEGVELLYVNRDVREYISDDVDIDSHIDSGKKITELIPDEVRSYFRTSNEIKPSWHVRMQAVWQSHVDSGISKTINLPFDATEEDVWAAYVLAWELNCKGITVYRNGSRQKEVLVSMSDSLNKSVDQKFGKDFRREQELDAKVNRIRTAHGNLYVTTAFQNGKLIEIFTHLGKSGAAEHAQSEALGRVISTALQYGVPASEIANQLKGITSQVNWDNGKLVRSVPDAIAQVIDQVTGTSLDETPDTKDVQTQFQEESAAVLSGSTLMCQECSSESVSMEEGCMKCYSCGFSKCE